MNPGQSDAKPLPFQDAGLRKDSLVQLRQKLSHKVRKNFGNYSKEEREDCVLEAKDS